MTPRSQMMEVIKCAGVTSKAGLKAATPAGAVGTPAKLHTSAALRCSMGMLVPSASDRSNVVEGATTWKGMPWARASTATP